MKQYQPRTLAFLKPDESSYLHNDPHGAPTEKSLNASHLRDILSTLRDMIRTVASGLRMTLKIEEISLFAETENERTGFMGSQRSKTLANSDIVTMLNPSVRQLGGLLNGSQHNPMQKTVIASTDPHMAVAIQRLSEKRILPFPSQKGMYGILRKVTPLNLSGQNVFPATTEEAIRQALLFPNGEVADYMTEDQLNRIDQADESYSDPDFAHYLREKNNNTKDHALRQEFIKAMIKEKGL